MYNANQVSSPSFTRFYAPITMCPGSPWLVQGDAVVFFIPASSSQVVSMNVQPIHPEIVAPSPPAANSTDSVQCTNSPLRCLRDGVANNQLVLPPGISFFEYPFQQLSRRGYVGFAPFFSLFSLLFFHYFLFLMVFFYISLPSLLLFLFCFFLFFF